MVGDREVGVVAICGKVRTGKSYLMNALLDDGGARTFGVSSQALSFTVGVRMSTKLVEPSVFGVPTHHECPPLLLVDMEGQGHRGLSYDVKVG